MLSGVAATMVFVRAKGSRRVKFRATLENEKSPGGHGVPQLEHSSPTGSYDGLAIRAEGGGVDILKQIPTTGRVARGVSGPWRRPIAERRRHHWR